MRLFVAAIRSAAAYLVVSLYVLVVGPPAIALALLVRSPRILFALGIFAVRVGLALVGIRYVVSGAQHILRDRAAVYAVNHASNLEPPVMFAVLRRLAPRLRVLYKAEMRSIPILIRAFDLAGFVPVERANRERSMHAIDTAAQALRAGHSFLIFPEGTRSRTGDLLPFKKGGFVMAIKAQAPIVPVAVSGAAAAMRRGSLIVRPVTVRVQLAPPVESTGCEHADRDRLIAVVRGEIQRMLSGEV